MFKTITARKAIIFIKTEIQKDHARDPVPLKIIGVIISAATLPNFPKHPHIAIANDISE
jgi:hypothetical protein